MCIIKIAIANIAVGLNALIAANGNWNPPNNFCIGEALCCTAMISEGNDHPAAIDKSNNATNESQHASKCADNAS